MKYLIALLASSTAYAGTILELPPLPTTPPPMPVVIIQAPVVTPGTPPVFVPFDTGRLVK